MKRRSPKRVRTAALAVTAAASLILAGCGSTTAATGTRPAESASPGAATEQGTGTEQSVAFTSTRYHYRISAPGAMAENADGSASYRSQVDRLEIMVVQGSTAADPQALASADLAKLRGLQGFKLDTPVSLVQLNGKRVVKFVYLWTDGISSVTGKPLNLVTARYYVARDTGTVAALAYSIVTNQYDPQGADDIAATFAWQ